MPKIIFTFFLLIIFTASCSKKETTPPNERAVARWEAIIAKDWDKAYEFQTPNYRKTYDNTTYRNSFGDALNWISVEFIAVDYPKEHLADVKIKITTTFSEAGNLPLPGILTERWQRIDNTWWYANSKNK